GVAGVARAEDERARPDPARQLVAADGRDRRQRARADRGRGEVAANRRAAHAADDQAAGALLARDAGRLDAPESVLHLVRLGADQDALVEDRALDRGVGSDRAVRAEHALGADVGTARQRALVDQRARLVALGQRRLDAPGEQVPGRLEIALWGTDVDPVPLGVPAVEALAHHLRE